MNKILLNLILLGIIGLLIFKGGLSDENRLIVGMPTFSIQRSIQPEENNLYWFGTSTKAWSDIFGYNLTASGTITFLGLKSSSDCLITNSSGVVSTTTCGGSGILFGTATSTAGINVATTTNTLTLSLRNSLADISGLATTTGNLMVASSTGGWEELSIGTNDYVLSASSTASLGAWWRNPPWLTAAITSLGGQTGATQTFSTSTAGINIASATNDHAFSLRETLSTISGLAITDSNFIVGNGTTWVAESGSTARTSLGLTIGTNVQAWDDDLDDLAALAPTKGDIITTAGTNWADLAVGTNGYVLTASSTATNGISWEATAAGGGGTAYNTIEFALNPAGAATATSSPAGSNKKIGTNWTLHTLDYDGATAENAFWTHKFPAFTALNACSFTGTAFASATTTASVAVLGISYKDVGNNAAWTSSASTTASTSLTFNTALEDFVNFSLAVSTSSIASADSLVVNVHRRPSESDDTNTADVRYANGKIICTYR